MNIPKMIIVVILLLVAVTTAMAGSGKVEGWFQAGTDVEGYEIGTEKTDAGMVAYIKSLKPDDKKFGTLMQSYSATQYLGKRIRMSASIKTVDVDIMAAMWMRVDANKETVSFDNMKNRPLSGSTDWATYTIVLDVPQESTNISMGLILKGNGEAFMDKIKVEIVSLDVPSTDFYKVKSGPTNLNFSQ